MAQRSAQRTAIRRKMVVRNASRQSMYPAGTPIGHRHPATERCCSLRSQFGLDDRGGESDPVTLPTQRRARLTAFAVSVDSYSRRELPPRSGGTQSYAARR